VTEVFRTPDERFADLPGFDLAPRYREVGGLRLAHVDEGDGPPVIFFHGEPTWSYVWRKVIGPVRAAGYRCIALDLPGFGRSDKPTDPGWYSYDRHVELAADLLDRLDLRGATAVVHDWGGPIGLRLAVEHPDRIARMVILDTALATGEQSASEAWRRFRDFVEHTDDLPIAAMMSNAVVRGMDEAVAAAYAAPFPTAASKAGARAFPLLVPTTPDSAGADANRRVLAALRGDDRPKLFLWAEADPFIPFEVGERFAAAIGADPPQTIASASHFLQEDAGDEVGRRIADWLAS
jgi:haloalkane dehalogenase